MCQNPNDHYEKLQIVTTRPERVVSNLVLSTDTTLLFVFKNVQVSNQKLILAKIEFRYNLIIQP